jgi:hypothetical protein
VKFVPRHSQIIGRVVIKRSSSSIVRVDETKVTKFVLVDAVGPGAEAKGIKVGDVVVAKTLSHIVMDGGTSFRPSLEEESIAFFVADLALDELAVQTDSGAEFVPLDSPKAAQPLGASPAKRESEAA